MTNNPPPPEECANCGAAIPRGAKACPGCGADERTGWRDASVYDGLNLPDAAYADEPAGPPLRRRLPWYFVVAAVLAILAALVFTLGGR